MKSLNFLLVAIAFFSACSQNNGEANKAVSTSATDSSGSSSFKPANVNEQAIYQRAFQAVIWGMPAVNSELMHQSLVAAKGDYNQIIYWSGLVNSKNQTLTPNPDVIYVNPFFDTRKGPVVLEIPPVNGASSITGSIDDAWQTPIEDVGPAGVDKGKGGKYLLLPPGYREKIPAGYIPMRLEIYTGFVILRSNLTNGSKEDIERAVNYGKQVKIYPYADAKNPPPTNYLDLLQIDFSNVIPYDFRFFESLNSFVQREPWLTRDMAMVDVLKSIGIEKGKAFNPDAQTRAILNAAIRDAHTWIDQQYESVFTPAFYEGTNWAIPAKPDLLKAMMENYADPNNYPVDSRATVYTMAYFAAKHLGTGQYYLMTIRDKDKNSFNGANSYQLHLPPNVPVNLYWSVTVYDRETHALIKGMPHSSRASTSAGIQKNADGSVDVYFGPRAPAGKKSNWVPTDPNGKFELLARFYGPKKEFFEKAWKMGDVEKIK
ncbi:MAG: hypothetical protein C5B52_16380 [Bacteroidetes bacterium]|nr:MAG: hypothetical protein C5B52_16380 [Bacteroidota bacterium]